MPDAPPPPASPLPDAAHSLAPLLQRAGAVIDSEIRGRSMGKTLPPGTKIRIRCATGADYAPGTVIAFLGGNGLVGHRVVGRAGAQYLLTRGDGTVICDPPVEASRVLGEIIEWQDGEAWRAVPAAPTRGALSGLVATAVQWFIGGLHRVQPRLAAGSAAVLMKVGRRLSAGQ